MLVENLQKAINARSSFKVTQSFLGDGRLIDTPV